MTLPLTGTTPAAGGYTTVDNRFQGGHRTGLIAVLFRDARGPDSNISPHNSDGSPAWSPFAQDGQLRADLFAQKLVDGVWVENQEENEGWYLAGAFGEGAGPSQRPSLDIDDQMIEQSNLPFESDLTRWDEPFSFQALQNLQPAIQRLLNNLPLSAPDGSPLVELPGEADGYAQVVETEKIGRQFLLYGIRKKNGKFLYEVDAYDYAVLTDKGERRFGKRGTAAELTFKPELSGFYMAHVDGEYRPIVKYTHIGGEAWADMADGS